MENKKKKSTGLLLSILGVISLVLITAGVTYAFFSYAKQGEKENVITTGTITFEYTEGANALTISDALPKSDSVGIGENATDANVFQFNITSKTPSKAYIDYIVTARKKDGSTIDGDQVKLYLTSSASDSSTEPSGYGDQFMDGSSVKVFSALDSVKDTKYNYIVKTTDVANGIDERVLYKGRVPVSQSSDFTRSFRLNMWLKGAETIAAHCEFTENETTTTVTEIGGQPATSENCIGTGYTWVPESTNSNGVADYSAYEFVKKSAVSGTTPISVDSLITGNNILKSSPYYSGVEGGTINASEWERIAYVDYTNKTVLTRSQAVALNLATDDATNGFVYTTPSNTKETISGVEYDVDEQYYPLNGAGFTVTINVYAEGKTTYTTGS